MDAKGTQLFNIDILAFCKAEIWSPSSNLAYTAQSRSSSIAANTYQMIVATMLST